EALRRITGRAFAEIHAAVANHGGSVESTTGEAVTAVFGIPVVHEDDALRALRAAAEMGAQLFELATELEARRGPRLELRLGVSTGEVITGGAQLQATGEPLTAAVRLGQVADPGEILLDESTYRLARDSVEVEPGGEALRLVEVVGEPIGQVSPVDRP